MKPLDDELRNALKRKEPPEGFADRVLARLEHAPRERKLMRRPASLWRRPALRWVAVAAACLLAVAGIARYQHQQRVRAQAEQASRQAVWALEMASTELNTALQEAQRITVQALAAPKTSKTRME
jgi:ferric-dicitrate binding protein FerR (iron transport regulator)